MSGARRDERAPQQRPERGGDDHRTESSAVPGGYTKKGLRAPARSGGALQRGSAPPTRAERRSARVPSRALAHRRLNVAYPLGVLRAGHALVKVEELRTERRMHDEVVSRSRVKG